MVRSPLYSTIDGHDEGRSARSTAPTTPEHQSSAAAVESVGRAQRSSEESHAKQKAGNLKINTDAGLEEDASSENAICVCTPAQKVPRPPNCKWEYCPSPLAILNLVREALCFVCLCFVVTLLCPC